MADPFVDLRREVPVALGRPGHDQPFQIRVGVQPVRNLEAWQVEPLLGGTPVPEHQVQLAPLCDQQRRVARLRQLAKDVSHLGGALQIELLRVELQSLRIRLELLLLDAEQDVVRLRIPLQGVVQIVRGDRADAERRREGDLLGQDAPLVIQSVILQLHEVAIGAEDFPVPTGRLFRAALLPGEEQRRHLAREASGETDDPLGMLGEQLPVHPGTVVEAL